jgi:hypothetical protein
MITPDIPIIYFKNDLSRKKYGGKTPLGITL